MALVELLVALEEVDHLVADLRNVKVLHLVRLGFKQVSLRDVLPDLVEFLFGEYAQFVSPLTCIEHLVILVVPAEDADELFILEVE